jgi:pSer/pThr/pTyr-binding forkhead associated (FHA) protein
MMESEEIPKAMLTGRPVAYFTLVENDQRIQVFGLSPGINTIGRNPNSTVPIPMHYESVSRIHARVLHSINGTFIEDLGSKYGTHVNGYRLEKEQPVELKVEDTVILCQPGVHDRKACILRFSRLPPLPPPPHTQ